MPTRTTIRREHLQNRPTQPPQRVAVTPVAEPEAETVRQTVSNPVVQTPRSATVARKTGKGDRLRWGWLWLLTALVSFIGMTTGILRTAQPIVAPNDAASNAQAMTRLVHPGMSKPEVYQQIGRPDEVSWHAAGGRGRGETVTVRYQRPDGVLTIDFSGADSGNGENFGVVQSEQFTASPVAQDANRKP